MSDEPTTSRVHAEPRPQGPAPATVVVKVGSAVLAPGGSLDRGGVDRLADEIAAVVRTGRRVVLVSSGAVACGLAPMGLSRMPERLSLRQAAAAAGQPRLMRAWSRAFERSGLACAQVLLTGDDVDFRARFVNAHRTVSTLLDAGLVPIVNENDSVTFEELKLGDNDRLSALVAGLVDAEALVILTKAPGLCARDGGGLGPVIERVDDVAAARANVLDAATDTGIGGMATKLDAAETATRMGIETVVASGLTPGALGRAVGGLASGGPTGGTRFAVDRASTPGHAGRKRWIAHALRSRGALVVDDGAKRALVERGASLLPGGVVAVEAADAGGFEIGAAVDVRTGAGPVFARGLVSYRSSEIERILGLASSEIEGVLGYNYCDEVIHRDDLILL